MSDRIIRGISIQPDGVMIEYLDVATDIRTNGLTLNHTCFIPFGDDYDDELEEVVEAAQRALSDALDDFDNLEPHDVKAEITAAAEMAVAVAEAAEDAAGRPYDE